MVNDIVTFHRSDDGDDVINLCQEINYFLDVAKLCHEYNLNLFSEENYREIKQSDSFLFSYSPFFDVFYNISQSTFFTNLFCVFEGVKNGTVKERHPIGELLALSKDDLFKKRINSLLGKHEKTIDRVQDLRNNVYCHFNLPQERQEAIDRANQDSLLRGDYYCLAVDFSTLLREKILSRGVSVPFYSDPKIQSKKIINALWTALSVTR